MPSTVAPRRRARRPEDRAGRRVSREPLSPRTSVLARPRPAAREMLPSFRESMPRRERVETEGRRARRTDVQDVRPAHALSAATEQAGDPTFLQTGTNEGAPPMPDRNRDLHGNAPDHSRVALLLIDVINDLEFSGGDRLLRHATPMVERIVALKRRAKQAGIPTIYVNDNFGRWQSNFNTQVDHCLQDDVRGRPLAEALRPDEDDYFVLKPKHSGFFSTTLDILLRYLQARLLILTGIAGNNCVLFTANDAYMRDFHLWVPADCVASVDEQENRNALEQMRVVLKADVRPSSEVDLGDLTRATYDEAEEACRRRPPDRDG